MSIPTGQDQDRTLSRLLEAAIETGATAGAEHIARKLRSVERTPALIRIARVSLDHGDTGHARKLLAEALSMETWLSQRPWSTRCWP